MSESCRQAARYFSLAKITSGKILVSGASAASIMPTSSPQSIDVDSLHRSGVAKMEDAVLILQSFFRGQRARQLLKKKNACAAIIQKAFRNYLCLQRSKKFEPIIQAHKSLDAKLASTRNRLLEKEREFQLLSVMSSSRVRSYQKELCERAAITSTEALPRYITLQSKRMHGCGYTRPDLKR